LKKNIFLKSIKDDHADGYRSGSGLIRSILGDSELPSQKNRTFITIWKSWFSYEFPLVEGIGYAEKAEQVPRDELGLEYYTSILAGSARGRIN
jgi:hypothetical protein